MLNRLALITAGFAALPAIAFAHPHIYAEARMDIIESDSGTVSEVRNLWRFDDMFSASVVMDFDNNSNLTLDDNELSEIGATVLESLAEFDYYTYVTVDGKNVQMEKPDKIHVTYDNQQVIMFFSIKPKTELAINGTLSFGAWDPTLYTALDFANDMDLTTEGSKISMCKRTVVRPDADEVMEQNQDKLTESFFEDPTSNDLSKLFATRLELSC